MATFCEALANFCNCASDGWIAGWDWAGGCAAGAAWARAAIGDTLAASTAAAKKAEVIRGMRPPWSSQCVRPMMTSARPCLKFCDVCACDHGLGAPSYGAFQGGSGVQRARSRQQQMALLFIARHLGGAQELGPCFLHAAQARQQI